jgi:hypothetical protein
MVGQASKRKPVASGGAGEKRILGLQEVVWVI